MRINLFDQGPKPFRVLNFWFQVISFHEVVKEVWKDLMVQGWGAFVLKEKLKGVKVALKKWNVEVFGFMNTKLRQIEINLNELDIFY